MNLALSEEQALLREAARGALSRVDTLHAARAALDGASTPDLWQLAKDAGWPGLLIGEEHGGAGLDAFDAMLVLGECGRTLAQVPLLGHLPASAILGADSDSAEHLSRLATGELRAAYLPAAPPSDIERAWTVDPLTGPARAQLPLAEPSGDVEARAVRITGTFAFVPDAPGADLLVGVALLDGSAVGFAVEADEPSLAVSRAESFDATRSLGHVMLQGTRARALDAPEHALIAAWHLAQALIAAEAVGSVEAALEVSVAYAKERHTFGRPIGSYQAIKHSLTEVLRQLDNGRSLLYYAGWSRTGAPEQFALAANAARSVAGRALEHASRTMISVHGGIGATWEHDAPLYFRRAQLTRRLLGGTDGATDRVAGEMLSRAAT